MVSLIASAIGGIALGLTALYFVERAIIRGNPNPRYAYVTLFRHRRK